MGLGTSNEECLLHTTLYKVVNIQGCDKVVSGWNMQGTVYVGTTLIQSCDNLVDKLHGYNLAGKVAAT